MRVLITELFAGCGSLFCPAEIARRSSRCFDCGGPAQGRGHTRLCRACHRRRSATGTLDRVPRFPHPVKANRLVAKTCRGCGELQDAERFGRQTSGPGGRSTKCKFCTLERVREHSDERNAYLRSWRKANGQRDHAYQLKQQYGLAHGEYDALVSRQQGVCAVCKLPETTLGPTGRVRRLSVDHDHVSGVVRGLLCNSCNRALGAVKDSPALLRALAVYLEAYQCAS